MGGLGFARYLLLVCYAMSSGSAEAADFLVLTGPYLGQPPPGTTPRLFAPEIVSSEDCDEFVCVFSPDGRECVFDRYGETRYREGVILTSRLVNGRWTAPEPHDRFTRYKAFQPSVAPNRERWFFTSSSLPVPDNARGVLPLFYIDKTASGWSEPVYIGDGIHASALG